MRIEVAATGYARIEPMRDLYRQEADCQIIHDSTIRRGLADPYLIMVDGAVGGYGGVWSQYYPGRLMEFYTLPHLRAQAQIMFRELLVAARVTEMEAQTNMPLMVLMLYDFATGIVAENVLFHDAFQTALPCPGGVFRHARAEDGVPNPDREWVVDVDGTIAAVGGVLGHYNPPYGDLYMETAEPDRRKGFGSYIVQELKRVCYESGRRPAARCDADNTVSRRTLEKAGMLPCGRLLVGTIAEPA